MSQRFLVNDFKRVEYLFEFDESFMKSYNEENDKVYFFEVDIQYPQTFYNLHNDLPFSSERTKIEESEELVANLHDKTEHVIHIRNLKQVLNHILMLRKVIRVIIFNQKDWLRPFVDMNTDLKEKSKNDFEKDLF